MDWSNLRGTAINNPPPKERDLDLIEYKIEVIINKELEDYISKLQIKDNQYCKWTKKINKYLNIKIIIKIIISYIIL